MEKLKPCPFCGGEPNIHDDDGKHPEFEGIWWQVYCLNCFCSQGWFSSPEKAVNAWNRRTQ